MTRGRKVTRGVDNAIRIAGTRGCVMKFCSGPESMCDFMIRTPTSLVFVRVKRFDRITSGLPVIEAEHRSQVLQLRSFPGSAIITRELWIYSKHGTYRYFRVGNTTLEEIDITGLPLRILEGDSSTAADTVATGATGAVSSP
jgi:hypothetical protein